MGSLKQQLLILVIGPLLLISILLTTIIGSHMQNRAVLATNTKVKSDLAAGAKIIDLMYPGPWEVRDGELYKGEVKINNNFDSVDSVASLTGDTVTIFLGDTRVSTTVRSKNGDRVVGTKVSVEVANTVLQNGQEFVGEANVVGERYWTAYKPLRDESGKIIGMFYVGISKTLSDGLIRDSLLTIVAISGGLTMLVAVGAWFFTQRVIVGPLQQLTRGTREVALGQPMHKIEVTTQNEIGELAGAFNQMVEGLQRLAVQISRNNGNQVGTGEMVSEVMLPIPGTGEEPFNEEELPKGLHETTLRQILAHLEGQDKPMSAEEVGDGVCLTRVTARRYLEYLEKSGRVAAELKYGTVGRPVKLYHNITK
ncbi:MAG: cache domain-containing protein [Thermincolia bacterium]